MTLRGFLRGRPALLVAAALLLPALAGAEPLDLAFPEDDGVDQTPGHFAFDFLRAAEMVIKDSGIDGHWMPLPNKRLMYEIQQERPNFCIAGAGITAEREQLGKFTLPFFEDRMMAVLALPSASAKLDKAHSLEELIALGDTSFLGYVGMNYGSQVSPVIEKLGNRLVAAPRSTAQMLDMLLAGRADFAFLPYDYATNYLTARHDRRQFLIRAFPDMHRDFHTAFLCSRKVPDEVIAKLNDAIRRQQPAIEARFSAHVK